MRFVNPGWQVSFQAVANDDKPICNQTSSSHTHEIVRYPLIPVPGTYAVDPVLVGPGTFWPGRTRDPESL
jgi:hypothetical protein